MPQKHRRNKGLIFNKPKTSRIKVPVGMQQIIVNIDGKTFFIEEAANWGDKYLNRIIQRIRNKAYKQQKQIGTRNGSNRILLTDILNIENQAGRGRLYDFTSY